MILDSPTGSVTWSLGPREGNKDPLLKVVTTELAVVTAVTSKKRLARFWAFSTAVSVGSFSATLGSVSLMSAFFLVTKHWLASTLDSTKKNAHMLKSLFWNVYCSYWDNFCFTAWDTFSYGIRFFLQSPLYCKLKGF